MLPLSYIRQCQMKNTISSLYQFVCFTISGGRHFLQKINDDCLPWLLDKYFFYGGSAFRPEFLLFCTIFGRMPRDSNPSCCDCSQVCMYMNSTRAWLITQNSRWKLPHVTFPFMHNYQSWALKTSFSTIGLYISFKLYLIWVNFITKNNISK